MRGTCLLALSFCVAAVLAHADEPPADLDARVRDSLARGRDWLAATQRPDATFPSPYPTPGTQALALWALVESGADPRDSAVVRTVEYLRAHGDPSRGVVEHANYAAALTLVSLRAWYSAQAPGAIGPDRVAAARRLLTPADRDLVERCLRYVRSCCTGTAWSYQAMRTDPARLRAAGDPTPVARWTGTANADRPAAPLPWIGDNSNAQYAWMGIRAATLLGVTLDEDGFAVEELERMLKTRHDRGMTALSLKRDPAGGFPGLWNGPEIHENVCRVGWTYASGDRTLPTMTLGCVSSLLYAWQEAEERGRMTEPLRAKVRAAVLGGIAELSRATKESVAEG